MKKLVVVRGIVLTPSSQNTFNKQPTICCNHQLQSYMNYCPVCGADLVSSTVPVNKTNGDMSLFTNSYNQTLIGFAIAINDDFFNLNNMNNMKSMEFTLT